MAHRPQPVKAEGSRARFYNEELKKWEAEHNEMLNDDENDNESTTTGTKTATISAGPLNGETGAKSGTLRWPKDVKYDDSDYVLFQFGKYIPPFSRDSTGKNIDSEMIKKGKADSRSKAILKDIAKGGLSDYNLNNLDQDENTFANIVLPIPQDLSNEIQQVWQGKQFTKGGRAAIAGLAGGQFHYAGTMMQNITGHLKAAQNAITTAGLNSIPGVGGNLEFNDVSGSTQGIVINPNAELMYDAPEMREIGMVFKMVPRNDKESEDIRKIYQTFRMASLPSFGGKGGGRKLFGHAHGTDSSEILKNDEQEKFMTSENNWIRVPSLCKFTFMKGSSKHPHLIQFKPCAISKVEVNYTADGTYATYSDGAPLSVELTLNFMETKVIFRDDVNLDGGGF